MMMNPVPSVIEVRYCDSKNPTKNATQSSGVSEDIDEYNLMHINSTAVSLRPGISSRSNNEPTPQRPEEEEAPDISSFAHRSSQTSEDPNNNCSSTFTRMLLQMLEDAESKHFENIVSWVPGKNDLFRVHDSETFTREIAPLYFKCTKYKSFQRQLNLYGFSRIKMGVYKGGYTHQRLVRGKTELYNWCSFPRMLLKMLEDAESKHFENIVSWAPGKNNLFRVHDSKTFTREIAPLYFKCTQYKSFQRQLNLYGFLRIKTGLYTGGYIHELLVRGKPELCDYMMRTKVKGKKSFGSPVSMLSSSTGRAGKGEATPRLNTSREYMYQHMYQLEQEDNKHSTTTEELLDSFNNTSQAREDSAAVFGRNESHPRELQPGSLSPPSANHNDGWVANPRTTSSIHYPPIFPSPRQSSKGPAFDSNIHYGAFSREEIIDEIIQTFYR
jgi:hypothetical protein